MRRTKIVCTLGPASDSVEKLAELIDAGMDVARLNFSHGSHEEHTARYKRVREIAAKKGKHIAILQDLTGPKLRLGKVASPFELQSGDTITLTINPVPGDKDVVSVTFKELPDEVRPGDRILLADGALEFKVVQTTKTDVVCQVIDGGPLSSGKGINLPDIPCSFDSLTPKDKDDLQLGLKLGVDYVALSFVRRRDDIVQVKDIMRQAGVQIPVIAKIEKREALTQLDEILQEADGIMVARGDLAVETERERVPILQKLLIRKANAAGKPVITATQMLMSMVSNPRPTRAETNDVANAVLDGTDAVMLSEETTVGRYPLEAVNTMVRIIKVTENDGYHGILHEQQQPIESIGISSVAAAVSHGAVEIAHDLNASAILTPTNSGKTARLVARHRPARPIIALCQDDVVLRRLNLVRGVVPMQFRSHTNSDEMIAAAKKIALTTGLVHKGDTVVVTAGIPVGVTGATNLIKVDTVD